jgi:hypothetical protein
MKTTKMLTIILCLLIVCLFFAGQVLALDNRTTFKERTESWLKPSPAGNGYGGDTGGTGPGGLTGGNGTGSNEPRMDTPVQDALPLILVLSGVYCAMYLKRNKKEA